MWKVSIIYLVFSYKKSPTISQFNLTDMHFFFLDTIENVISSDYFLFFLVNENIDNGNWIDEQSESLTKQCLFICKSWTKFPLTIFPFMELQCVQELAWTLWFKVVLHSFTFFQNHYFYLILKKIMNITRIKYACVGVFKI